MIMKNLLFGAFVTLLAISYNDCSILKKSRLNLKELQTLPEQFLNVSQLIEFNGYPCENHEVKTEDGYILSLQRIPYGRKNPAKRKGVILLQHGLLDSANTWVMNLPSQSLGFLLADDGYEVWLGNSRGSTYSKKHVKYTTKDAAFWDFSFDEMAKYDLPATIDCILHVSGASQIYYAAHSQGTMMAFIEFSRNQELAKKVKMFFALAPVTTVGYIKGAFRVLSNIGPELLAIIRLFGIHEFLPNNWFFKFMADNFCDHEVLGDICEIPIFMLCGWDIHNLNTTRIPVYINHAPAGTSVKNIVHYMQLVKSKKFQMYDYGEKGNMKHYNQATAPNYNITNLNVPTAFFMSKNDWLADPKDINEYLMPRVNHTVFYKKTIKEYEHMDFVWAFNANKFIYSEILNMVNKNYE